MSVVAKVLIGLASLAFLSAVFTALLWPIFNIPAESFSRACSNLALIAIALLLCAKGNLRSA
jgi:hypothetical protein